MIMVVMAMVMTMVVHNITTDMVIATNNTKATMEIVMATALTLHQQ